MTGYVRVGADLWERSVQPWRVLWEAPRGLPGRTPVVYKFREFEFGYSMRGLIGMWFDVGQHGEVFYSAHRN